MAESAQRPGKVMPTCLANSKIALEGSSARTNRWSPSRSTAVTAKPAGSRRTATSYPRSRIIWTMSRATLDGVTKPGIVPLDIDSAGYESSVFPLGDVLAADLHRGRIAKCLSGNTLTARDPDGRSQLFRLYPFWNRLHHRMGHTEGTLQIHPQPTPPTERSPDSEALGQPASGGDAYRHAVELYFPGALGIVRNVLEHWFFRYVSAAYAILVNNA